VVALLLAPWERGQGLVEYALLLALIVLVVLVILMLFGPEIGNVFSNIVDSI
jgi:pilus assembly protein Flp/PilA